MMNSPGFLPGNLRYNKNGRYQTGTGRLQVTEGQVIPGGVGVYDFIYYLVRDVMISNPITVVTGTTIETTQEVFAQHDFNGLPVVDNQGHLVGMVTKLDVLKAFVFTRESKVPQYSAIMNRSVDEIMKKDIVTVDMETPLTRVLQRMIDTRFKSIPVVEEGKLVGIVAREDVLRALQRAAKGLQPERLMGAGSAQSK